MTDRDGRKIAWVTGAGKGIGRAVSKRLADDGWVVAASARTESDLAQLTAEAPPGLINPFPLDVTDSVASETVVGTIESELGPIDLALLNAGTHIPVPIDNFTVDPFRRIIETNLMGTVHGLAALIPRFIERKGGQLAVVSSVAGYRGLPTAAAYGASKAALINMCEALKPELEAHGVQLKLINPGFVETPLTDNNEFPMPFLISAEEAAERIVKGLKGTAFEIVFPTRMAITMKLMRFLPNRLLFAITSRIARK